MTNKPTHYLVSSVTKLDCGFIRANTTTPHVSFSTIQAAVEYVEKHRNEAEKRNIVFNIEPIIFEG